MHTHTNTHTRIQIRHSTHTQTHSHQHTHKHINTHTHVHTPILRLSRTHYFFVCYSPSLHTHARTLKQNKHTHKQFKTQIHTHTQTYRYVARVCDEMCLQVRKQGRERREPKWMKKRERERKEVCTLVHLHGCIACICVRVNACVCKNSQTDHIRTQSERDTDIQRIGVFAFMRACSCIHQMLAC